MRESEQARAALIARILEGAGQTSTVTRRAAFDNQGLAEPLASLLQKVARHAAQVTDDDLARVLSSGISEDEIFELVVCAAVGEATRLHSAAQAALAAVMERG
jgi:hypothetical protein